MSPRPYIVNVARSSPVEMRSDAELDDLDRDHLINLRDDLEQEISNAKVSREDMRGAELSLETRRIASLVRYQRRIQAALAREKEARSEAFETRFVRIAIRELPADVYARLQSLASGGV